MTMMAVADHIVHVEEMATPIQAVEVEYLAERQHAEIGGKLQFDVSAVRRKLAQCGADDARENLNCWIAFYGDNAIGYLGAFAAPSWWSERIHTHVEIVYVVPEHRGSTAFLRLIKSFESWSRMLGAEVSFMNVSHFQEDVQSKRVLGLMERLGYKLRGYYAAKVME